MATLPPQSKRWTLASLKNPSDVLTFQYNPESLTESLSQEWGTITVPGGRDELAQFSGSTSPTLSLSLLFDCHNQRGANDEGNPVETAIAFIYKFASPAPGVSPVLVFTGPQTSFMTSLGAAENSSSGTGLPGAICRIDGNVQVERLLFSPSGRTTRAIINLTLRRFTKFPR